jgi:hypothetical protein
MLIDIEPGQAFDMLAIINIKVNESHGLLKEKNIANFESLATQIKREIGELKFNQVFESPEYEELYQSNLDTFNLVTLAQKDDGLAGRVDQKNFDRYVKKSILQKKYFYKEIKEIKIGYN